MSLVFVVSARCDQVVSANSTEGSPAGITLPRKASVCTVGDVGQLEAVRRTTSFPCRVVAFLRIDCGTGLAMDEVSLMFGAASGASISGCLLLSRG